MERSGYSYAASAAEESAPAAAPAVVEHADQSYGRSDQWHDPVTGLPRPQRFLVHLESVLATSARRSQPVAMLVLEIADLDAVRARLGDPVCDELLRTVAERLHVEVPEPNLVTRLRGGAFAIVLRELGGLPPEAVATHLLERASEPYASGGRLLRWALVGALASADGRAETAIQLFDRAMRSLARARLRSRLASDARRRSSERHAATTSGRTS